MGDKPCSRCGRCCTKSSFMGSLTATAADIRRWRREDRREILAFVSQFDRRSGGDIWVHYETGHEFAVCPFVEREDDTDRWICTIYETRPQVCRDYKAWAPGSVCVEVGDDGSCGDGHSD